MAEHSEGHPTKAQAVQAAPVSGSDTDSGTASDEKKTIGKIMKDIFPLRKKRK